MITSLMAILGGKNMSHATIPVAKDVVSEEQLQLGQRESRMEQRKTTKATATLIDTKEQMKEHEEKLLSQVWIICTHVQKCHIHYCCTPKKLTCIWIVWQSTKCPEEMRRTWCASAFATKPSSSKEVLTDCEEVVILAAKGISSNTDQSLTADEVHALSYVNTIIEWNVWMKCCMCYPICLDHGSCLLWVQVGHLWRVLQGNIGSIYGAELCKKILECSL